MNSTQFGSEIPTDRVGFLFLHQVHAALGALAGLVAGYLRVHGAGVGGGRGNAKYRCYDCGHQAIFAPAAPRRAAQYAQVLKLLVERNSQRSVVRVTGVARMTIARWIKKIHTGSS